MSTLENGVSLDVFLDVVLIVSLDTARELIADTTAGKPVVSPEASLCRRWCLSVPLRSLFTGGVRAADGLLVIDRVLIHQA